MDELLCCDPVLFEALYCQHHEVVYTVALRMVGNYAEAEDISQQVFLRAWSRPNAFRGGNIAAWLTTLAHNLSVDVLRRRCEVPLGDILPEAISILSAPQRTPEDEVVRAIIASCVHSAIESLRLNERFLVHAAFIEEQTHEQIAKAATLPLGTVKTRIRSGLRRMRPLTVRLQEL